MLSDIARLHGAGSLTGPETATSVMTVISFLNRHLTEFADKYANSSIENEKGLTQKLCNILNLYVQRERYPFWFDKEYMEVPEKGTSPQVDMGIIASAPVIVDSKLYDSDEAFFSLEAKRLRTLERKREKEYLVGRIEKGKYKECGGVERFKKEIHGKNLKYGGLVGYVQEYDFKYWHTLINSWVDNLIEGKIHSTVKWNKNDRLTQEVADKTIANYKSVNSRRKDNIILFHLWVNLTRN